MFGWMGAKKCFCSRKSDTRENASLLTWIAPNRLCSASILCGALRKAGVPASGASLRTFESDVAMGRDCSLDWGVLWIPVGKRAAIKRQSRGERKRQQALCPIHTMGAGESRQCDGLVLDGIPPRARRRSIKVREIPELHEPFAARTYSCQGRGASRADISTLNRIGMGTGSRDRNW